MAKRKKQKDWTSPDVISGQLLRIGFRLYADYLASDHWQTLRRRYEGKPCEKCGRPGRQLHHLTYERLGAELPQDLRWLCRNCHRNAHRRRKRRSAARDSSPGTPRKDRDLRNWRVANVRKMGANPVTVTHADGTVETRRADSFQKRPPKLQE